VTFKFIKLEPYKFKHNRDEPEAAERAKHGAVLSQERAVAQPAEQLLAGPLIKQEYQQFNDPFFRFWKGFALFKQNSLPEAINELSQMRNKKEFAFAVNTALLFYHQIQKSTDRVNQ